MVYLLDELDEFNENEIYEMLKIMPLNRINQFHRYRFFKDKRLCILAYLLFLYGMMREEKWKMGDFIKVPFELGADGKPYLKGLESLYFNISHCDKSIVCGISEYPIGVDVQDYEEIVDENMMRFVFSDIEIKEIQESTDPERSFTRYWTLKESYYKCIGTGLLDDMRSKNFAVGQGDQFYIEGFYFYTRAMQSYQLSVCEEKENSESLGLIWVSAKEIKEMTKKILY